MLVIHRASEPPKLTVRAPAPAHRVWAVRLVVALLVVLLVVSNTALGGGRGNTALGGGRGKRPKHPPNPPPNSSQHIERPTPQPLHPGPSPFSQLKHPAQADGRQDGSKLQPPPTPEGAEDYQGVLSAGRRALQGVRPQTIEKQSGDNIRALWGDYARQEPPRLQDGRYALPKLNELESALPAQQVYRLTKEILQQHPVELLERDADGRFQSIQKFETTSSDANIFSELRKRHTTAMTNVLAWAAHNKISALQSSVSPTQSGSGKLKLSVPDLRQSLLDLPIGEKSVATRSVDQKDGFSGTNLPEVSSLEVHGDSPNTLLDIKLKPKEGQVDKYVVGRAHLDKMINTINTAMDKFLNAP